MSHVEVHRQPLAVNARRPQSGSRCSFGGSAHEARGPPLVGQCGRDTSISNSGESPPYATEQACRGERSAGLGLPLETAGRARRREVGPHSRASPGQAVCAAARGFACGAPRSPPRATT
jgi:hypothetical protein